TVEPSGGIATGAARAARARLRFVSGHGCTPFPEAGLNAVGPAPHALNRDGTVFGYADAHLHITADHRARGRVESGESFDPVNAQLVEDQSLCNLEPRKSHTCDETQVIELELEHLRALQDYVDAQSGGRGRGWLRLVSDPWQARQVIEQGKLAVLVGVESSNLFDC